MHCRSPEEKGVNAELLNTPYDDFDPSSQRSGMNCSGEAKLAGSF